MVEISDLLVRKREPVLLLGDSGTHKTSMIELILQKLGSRAYLVHAENFRYRKHKKNWNLQDNLSINPIRCRGFDKRDIEKYIDSYLLPRLEGNFLIIEDLKELYSRGNSLRKKIIIDSMLSKVRYAVFATTQDISNKRIYETARLFPNIILFSLRVLDNLAKLSSSRAYYREIDRRRTTLPEGNCLFLRPTQTLISENSYHWTDIDSVIKFLNEGINSVGCYSPKDNKKKSKKRDPDRETRYVEVAKIFYDDPSKTYLDVAESLGIEESTVGVLVNRCRRKEYLPDDRKITWTRESIAECLVAQGIELVVEAE